MADALHRYGLTERHARALLRLEDPEQRLAAVEHIGKNQLNVADAEGYIDRLVAQNQTTQPRRRSAYIIKDVRLFLNSAWTGASGSCRPPASAPKSPAGIRRTPSASPSPFPAQSRRKMCRNAFVTHSLTNRVTMQ